MIQAKLYKTTQPILYCIKNKILILYVLGKCAFKRRIQKKAYLFFYNFIINKLGAHLKYIIINIIMI